MKIEIYTTRTCPFCVAAKAWLAEHGYTYEEISLDDPADRAAFKEANPELRTVPQIFADGELIGGYDSLQTSRLA